MTVALIRLGAWFSKFPVNNVFVSRTSKIQHEALGYCTKNSCTIPNGFDTDLFIPSKQARLAIRSLLNLSEDSCLIGLMARYHPMKDHANFIRAAALISKDFPNTHFLLAGTKVDRENQFLQQSIPSELADRIHLLGERSDMPCLTAALDIAASSSAYGEAFPLIVGEAMSCGVPCVVTDVGDSSWIVDSTGRVVPPRNPEALANAWKELINLGIEGRESLGRSARTRIIQYFAIDSIVSQYEALYEKALVKKQNHGSVPAI